MLLVYEYLVDIINRFEDIHGNKLRLMEFQNLYNINYKEWKSRYLRIVFSKNINQFTTKFEIKLFIKPHYE